MKRIHVLAGAVLAIGLSAHAQQVIIANWTFESAPAAVTTNNTSATMTTPDSGAGTFTEIHAVGSAFSFPAGNGSARSMSANTWTVNDYYQFQVSTLGNAAAYLTLSYDQAGSSTGPKNFQLAYSTDGTTFNNIGSTYIVPASTWSSTPPANSLFTFTPDLSSLPGLVGQTAVYFRMFDANTTSINGGTVAATGTDRIDNVIIAFVPEPSSMVLVATGSGVAGLFFMRRRKQ